MSGQLHVPAALPRGKTPGTSSVGGKGTSIVVKA